MSSTPWEQRPDGPGAIGTSPNGWVRIELDAGGRVSDIALNPQVMLTSTTELGADLVEAFQRAQDACRAQAEQASGSLPSPERLQALADRITEDADRRFSEISTALHDLNRRAGSEW